MRLCFVHLQSADYLENTTSDWVDNADVVSKLAKSFGKESA